MTPYWTTPDWSTLPLPSRPRLWFYPEIKIKGYNTLFTNECGSGKLRILAVYFLILKKYCFGFFRAEKHVTDRHFRPASGRSKQNIKIGQTVAVPGPGQGQRQDAASRCRQRTVFDFKTR